jgi:hypothetical protein
MARKKGDGHGQIEAKTEKITFSEQIGPITET